MRRVLCFGDSNTYGYSPVDGQRYGDDINWPGVLDRLLGDKFEVINEGKNGRTVAFDDPYKEGCNGMNDIESCIEEHEPVDLVIIMLGTNDLKVYFDASPQIIAENLREMCKIVQTKTDARIILASPALLGDQIEFSPEHRWTILSNWHLILRRSPRKWGLNLLTLPWWRCQVMWTVCI